MIDAHRTFAALFAMFVSMAALPARADIPSPATIACEGKSKGSSCKTEDGVSGTCVEMYRPPKGQRGTHVVCLSPSEIEEGRKTGWLVERNEVAPDVSVPWRTYVVVSAIALAAVVLALIALLRRRAPRVASSRT